MYQLQTPVHPHEDCVAWWGADSITVRQMCMGTDTTSACGVGHYPYKSLHKIWKPIVFVLETMIFEQGDSGSPLVCWKSDKWVLAGVTSWGDSDCEGDYSVYSRVSEFLGWIEDVTGLNRNC